MLKSNTLTPNQKLELQTIYDSSAKAHFRNRCQCILLIDQGMNVKETASIYKVRTRTIYTWYKNYKKDGLGVLNIREGRGIKAILDTFSAETIEIIKSEVSLHPQNIKGVVASLRDKINIDLTAYQLKRFLKKTEI
jgi:transposase